MRRSRASQVRDPPFPQRRFALAHMPHARSRCLCCVELRCLWCAGRLWQARSGSVNVAIWQVLVLNGVYRRQYIK